MSILQNTLCCLSMQTVLLECQSWIHRCFSHWTYVLFNAVIHMDLLKILIERIYVVLYNVFILHIFNFYFFEFRQSQYKWVYFIYFKMKLYFVGLIFTRCLLFSYANKENNITFGFFAIYLLRYQLYIYILVCKKMNTKFCATGYTCWCIREILISRRFSLTASILNKLYIQIMEQL